MTIYLVHKICEATGKIQGATGTVLRIEAIMCPLAWEHAIWEPIGMVQEAPVAGLWLKGVG